MPNTSSCHAETRQLNARCSQLWIAGCARGEVTVNADRLGEIADHGGIADVLASLPPSRGDRCVEPSSKPLPLRYEPCEMGHLPHGVDVDGPPHRESLLGGEPLGVLKNVQVLRFAHGRVVDLCAVRLKRRQHLRIGIPVGQQQEAFVEVGTACSIRRNAIQLYGLLKEKYSLG